MKITALVLFGVLGLLNCSDLNKNGHHYDTIVIGLGSAGTTAASTLAHAGKRVLALEAQDRVGGRVWTVGFGDGLVELGAEWIHGTKGSRVYNTAVNASIPLVDAQISTEAYYSNGTKGNSKLIEELIMYAMEVDEEAPEKPMPAGDFIAGKLKEYIKEKYPKLFNDTVFVEETLRLMNRVISNYEAANDWNDLTTASQYQDLEGNKLTSWGRNGYKTFFELLLNKYNNGPGLNNLDIKLNSKVTNINYEDGTNGVNVTCKDGSSYRADNVIVTVSLGVLKNSYKTLFTPPLVGDKVTAIENLAMGVVNKVILKFSETWWSQYKPFFSLLWKNEEIRKLNDGDRDWMSQMFYISCPEGSNDTLTVWFHGNAAKKIESIPDKEITTKCMQVIRMFMGKNKTIPDPVGVVRSSWYSNPFTRGSYTYDNSWLAVNPWGRAAVRRPIRDRVLFAGEVTNDIHYSTVHGASDTGYREAMRVIEGKFDK